MENYRLLSRGSVADDPLLNPGDIRITENGKVKNYVSAAFNLLDTNCSTIRLLGRGNSISKAVTVAEIVKRKSKKTLQQFTDISSIESVDVWEPILPELDNLIVKKNLPTITISLSIEAK